MTVRRSGADTPPREVDPGRFLSAPAAAPRALLLWQIRDLLRQYAWGRLWWETQARGR